MARFRLQTFETAAAILPAAARHLADHAHQGWCAVVPRGFLQRDLTEALTALRRPEERSWVGPRVVTVRSLIDHYAQAIPTEQALTALQMRQVVTACVLEEHHETGGRAFAGKVIGGRVSEATVHALTRLFVELEPLNLRPNELAERLLRGAKNGDPNGALSSRARDTSAVYVRYRARLSEANVRGRLGYAVEAALRAATDVPPFGLRSFYFLGFDGSGPNDIALRLADALRANERHVEDIVVALTYPESPAASRWSAHGNDMLVRAWREAGIASVPAPTAEVLDTLVATPDLRAVVQDPFAYRLGSAPAGDAVTCIRVPDAQLEIDWVAADIKRRLLVDPTLRPDDIAVVSRCMDTRERDVVMALDAVGLPVVSSRELRASDTPAVRALLTLFRVPALDWRPADVLAVAESPYFNFDLNPTLLAELAARGTVPHGAAAWAERIANAAALTPAGTPADPSLTVADHAALGQLEAAFSAFRRVIDSIERACTPVDEPVNHSPAGWLNALRATIDECNIEARIFDTSAAVERTTRAQLAREDLDGVNALVEGTRQWLAARGIAGREDQTLSLRDWYAELETIGATMTVRATSYPRKAVHLLDPIQAALRAWRVVYVIGLTDGEFPRAAGADEYALSDEERKALQLPTSAEKTAKEGLYFQLAAATAREALVLVTPAADDRGKALVASPFITCLELRLDGFAIRQTTARSLVPTSFDSVYSLNDIDLLAAVQYRDLAATAPTGTLATTLRADPLLAAWVGRGAGGRTIHAWGIERAREAGTTAGDIARLTPDARMYVGIVPEAPQVASLQDPAAAFSPTELATFDSCHYKWFLTKVLGVRAGDDTEADEAASFGSLQHRILERLFRGLERDGLLPPRTADDVDEALRRLTPIARKEVQTYMAATHEQVWEIDFAVVVDVLRAFVRRHLTAWRRRATDARIPQLRTRLVGLEVPVGMQHPIVLTADGVTFGLRGKIDRIEAVDDDRLSGNLGKLNGWLVITDYKSGRRQWAPKLQEYLAGGNLQLPLYAKMAEAHYATLDPTFQGKKAFAATELTTSVDLDMPVLARRQVVVARRQGETAIELAEVPGVEGGNPLETAIEGATKKAAGLVTLMRAGTFAPQVGRNCFGCQFADVCRAALRDNPAQARQRGQMPLGVTAAMYQDAGGAANPHVAPVEEAIR